MRLLATAIVMLTAIAASGQLVQFGSNDPGYCLSVEHVKPNLNLSDPVQLKGRVVDQTGAPFKNTPVELRSYVSEVQQISVRRVMTDSNGNFNFGLVAKGKYRLLPSSTRWFRQPDKLDCYTHDKCSLDITLQTNGTDLPDSQCPIR